MTSEAKKRDMMRMLDVASNNSNLLSNRMSDYELGIQETSGRDNRTIDDKLSDSNFMNREVKTKVYALFNNDATQSEKFIDKLTTEQVDPQDFNVVYPQLVQLYKGSVAGANNIANTALQLIGNYTTTGVINQTLASNKSNLEFLDKLYKLVENTYDRGVITKTKGDKAADVIDDIESALKSEAKSDTKSEAKKSTQEIYNYWGLNYSSDVDEWADKKQRSMDDKDEAMVEQIIKSAPKLIYSKDTLRKMKPAATKVSTSSEEKSPPDIPPHRYNTRSKAASYSTPSSRVLDRLQNAATDAHQRVATANSNLARAVANNKSREYIANKRGVLTRAQTVYDNAKNKYDQAKLDSL